MVEAARGPGSSRTGSGYGDRVRYSTDSVIRDRTRVPDNMMSRQAASKRKPEVEAYGVQAVPPDDAHAESLKLDP